MSSTPTNVESQLDQIEAEAIKAGVKLRLGLVGKRGIDLLFIQRESGAPGSGATVMTNLCQFADKHRASISVYAYEANPSLMDYYRRFGFEIDPRGGDEAQMIRQPQKQI
jgi:hypothetical protein